MMPLAHYQALGRLLEQARTTGDATRIVELEAQLRHAPAVIRYLYLGGRRPPALGDTPPPPDDQREQLLEQVRAPAPAAVPAPPAPTLVATEVVLRPTKEPSFERPAVTPPPGASPARSPQRPELGSPPALRSTGASALHSVLVVDGDERILGAWKRTARERHVVTASDATTARQLANTERPDLAIVELRLGDQSGIDLVRELKRDLPDLIVVLCSGYLSVAAAAAAVRAGADIVAFKPITFREILQRIDDHAQEPVLEDRPSLARAEWEHIMRVLADCNGNVSMAARRLGIDRTSLERRRQLLAGPTHDNVAPASAWLVKRKPRR